MDNLKEEIKKELEILEKMIDDDCDRELIEKKKKHLKSMLYKYVKDL